MFAEAQSEELLNLLSQVRLVADAEERSDGQQQQQEQQQQQSALLADTHSSFKSTLASANATTTLSASLTMGSGSRAISPASGVGRYTASSTAAVSWTVHDSSSGGGGDGAEGPHVYTSPERAGAAAGRRTPATGAKVLQRGSIPGAALTAPPSNQEDDPYDVLREPKQLFFFDAHKRAALQQQQQPSHAYAPPAALSRSATSFTPNASVSGGGGGDGRMAAPFTAAAPDGLDVPTRAAVFASAVPRDRVTSPGGASVLSTVLSNYTQPLKPEQLQQQPIRTGGGGGLGEDGLARIAAEFERAAALDASGTATRDDYDYEGFTRLSSSAGLAASRTASDVWAPAPAPFSSSDQTARSPFLYNHPQPLAQQQQQQRVTPSKSPSYAASSTASSPLLGGVGAVARRTSAHADPTNVRVARGGAATTPLSLAQTGSSPQAFTAAPPPASPSAAAAEAAVADFFRVCGTGPEYGGAGVADLRRTVQENDAAWRLSVEAELNDLQRGAHPLYTAAGVAATTATPTTAISPLPPTSTTPYHQLLSQLRYSPQQGGGTTTTTTTTGAAGRAAQANTPPERRGSVPAMQTQMDVRRAVTGASAGVDHGHPSLMSDSPAAGSVGTYTAQVPRASPFAAGAEGVQQPQRPQQMSSTASRNSSGGAAEKMGAHRVPLRSWPAQSTPSLNEAPSLWERLSPYDRAAASPASAGMATAASVAAPGSRAAGGTAGTALFHTPDTVAKPVTLSSIAAQLQGREITSLLDEDASYSPSSLQEQQLGGGPVFRNAVQLSQRFPTPPNFTTAAAAGSVLSPMQSQQQQQRPGSAAQLNYQQQQQYSPSPHQQHQQQQSINYAPSDFQQQQQQHRTAAVSGGASLRALHPTPPQQQQQQEHHQQQQQPAAATAQRGSPVDASAPPTSSALHSPPTCSLRPSPQMRGADGSSPALRRYVITTPNTRANAAGGSGGRRSGGSPLGTYGPASAAGAGAGAGGSSVHATGGGSANTGATRDARPRVQLSHMANPSSGAASAALRSPLHTAASASATSTPGGGAMSSNTPLYHHSHAPHHGGHGTPAVISGGSFGSVAAAATSAAGTSVSSTAVRALIERLQALAPVVLSSAAPTPTNASSADVAPATTAATPAAAESGSLAIPDVASAAVILAMSHDQHGCRLLQAVLDAECDGEGEEKSSGTTGDEAQRTSRNPSNTGGGAVNTAERRRARRAEAFYHSTAVQVILRAIEQKLDTVMADGYGNFLLQKVFDMAPDAERQRLLRLPSLQHHLCAVACSPHGTFAVQRLVETVRNAEEERLVFVALERDLLRLLTNANGGHVLMKVMECIRRQYTALTTTTTAASISADGVPAAFAASSSSSSTPSVGGTGGGVSAAPPLRTLLVERVDALFAAIASNLLFVCQHKQGCCIVQKFLDFLNACAGLAPSPSSAVADSLGNAHHQQQQSMDYFDRMAALLLPHTHELSVHPFGNYVITRLVDVCYARGSTATIDAVATAMQTDLVRMCTNKFASNVVEHILRHCSERRIRSVCQTLMTRPAANGGALPPSAAAAAAVHPSTARLPLTAVVMDSYGNYVVQTLLTVAPVDELASTTSVDGGMLPVLQLLLPLLSSRNFGRKLETKTELAMLRVEQYQQQQQMRRRA